MTIERPLSPIPEAVSLASTAGLEPDTLKEGRRRLSERCLPVAHGRWPGAAHHEHVIQSSPHSLCFPRAKRLRIFSGPPSVVLDGRRKGNAQRHASAA
jgi:hypothetical protein